MSKKKPHTPSYRLHKPSGQAVVTLNGQDHYLGKHNTKASRRCYDELISRWLAADRQLPSHEHESITVKELLIRYYRYCKSYYAHRRTVYHRLSAVRTALRPIKELFGSTLVIDFGPKSLILLQNQLVDEKLSRKTINDKIQLIKRMFRWAVREEIVPPSVSHGLSTVDGLRAGESKAREPRKIKPVPDEFVDAILDHILPPARAMIEVQRCTGARPGEVTCMRGTDLEMSGSIWIYKPQYHKTERFGHEKEICLGPIAQDIICLFLRKNLEEYLFRPDEAEANRDTLRRRDRKTPLWPSHKKRLVQKRKRYPQRQPRDQYTTTYGRAIKRGCEK